MKMTQKQTLFVKGDVVCFVFNSLNYEATMTRTHYSSYKIYNLKNVKLIDGGNQMERANIKSSFITNIKKIHDNHIDEQPEEPEQPTEEPITNIVDEQPEEPITNIIDEQPVTKAKKQDKKIVKEPEQPKETIFKNCIMDNVKNLPLDVISNIIDYIPGVTTSTINDDSGYYRYMKYRYIKIYDLRLKYYEKNMDISL